MVLVAPSVHMQVLAATLFLKTRAPNHVDLKHSLSRPGDDFLALPLHPCVGDVGLLYNGTILKLLGAGERYAVEEFARAQYGCRIDVQDQLG